MPSAGMTIPQRSDAGKTVADFVIPQQNPNTLIFMLKQRFHITFQIAVLSISSAMLHSNG
jgi:hypothetical protein